MLFDHTLHGNLAKMIPGLKDLAGLVCASGRRVSELAEPLILILTLMCIVSGQYEIRVMENELL